jgi:hypothetical protein
VNTLPVRVKVVSIHLIQGNAVSGEIGHTWHDSNHVHFNSYWMVN